MHVFGENLCHLPHGAMYNVLNDFMFKSQHFLTIVTKNALIFALASITTKYNMRE